MKKTTVYVVSWDCGTSGGFDWYYKEDLAKSAFEKEKTDMSADKLVSDKEAVYYFEHETDNIDDAEAVTEEIDAKLFFYEDESADTIKWNKVEHLCNL